MLILEENVFKLKRHVFQTQCQCARHWQKRMLKSNASIACVYTEKQVVQLKNAFFANGNYGFFFHCDATKSGFWNVAYNWQHDI